MTADIRSWGKTADAAVSAKAAWLLAHGHVQRVNADEFLVLSHRHSMTFAVCAGDCRLSCDCDSPRQRCSHVVAALMARDGAERAAA